MPAYRITNGRRGSYTVLTARSGTTIPVGGFVDLELSEDEAKNAEYEGVTVEKIGGKSAKREDTPPKTAAEVLAMADDSEVQFMTFKAEAKKVLGEECPAKKDEIVAALKAKAEAE